MLACEALLGRGVLRRSGFDPRSNSAAGEPIDAPDTLEELLTEEEAMEMDQAVLPLFTLVAHAIPPASCCVAKDLRTQWQASKDGRSFGCRLAPPHLSSAMSLS